MAKNEWVKLWSFAKDETEGDAKAFALAVIAAHPGVIPPVLLSANMAELSRVIATAFASGRRWQSLTDARSYGASADDAFRDAFLDAAREDGKRGGK